MPACFGARGDIPVATPVLACLRAAGPRVQVEREPMASVIPFVGMARGGVPAELEWTRGTLLLVLVVAFCGVPGAALGQELSDAEHTNAIRLLEEGEPAERASAADLLGARGHARREAIVPLLRRRLREDADWRVRASSGRALGRLAARDAVPDLVRALRDPVVDVRVVAAAALWRLPDPAAVPALLELLRDSDAAARQWGALALGVIRDRRATRPLIALLSDPQPDVRLDAVRSLGRIRDPAAVSALEQYVNEAARPLEERLEAVDALALLDGPSKVDALVRLARHSDTALRTRAIQALGRVGDALVIPSLRERRRGETSPGVRSAIAAAIRAIEDRAAGREQRDSTSVPLNLPPLPGE